MKNPILLLEEADEDTQISWWNANRKMLNEIIRAFNEWQLRGFSIHSRYVVEALLNRCEQSAESNNFSDWQMETLSQMRQHLSATVDVEPTEIPMAASKLPEELVTKLEEFGEQWLSKSGQSELQTLIEQYRV